MTQFRVSKKLIKCGVPPEVQGLIFFTCLNVRRMDEAVQRKILNLCTDVAGDDYRSLYKFLTDGYVNHEYIYIHYRVNVKKLFEYKQRFYIEWHKACKKI